MWFSNKNFLFALIHLSSILKILSIFLFRLSNHGVKLPGFSKLLRTLLRIRGDIFVQKSTIANAGHCGVKQSLSPDGGSRWLPYRRYCPCRESPTNILRKMRKVAYSVYRRCGELSTPRIDIAGSLRPRVWPKRGVRCRVWSIREVASLSVTWKSRFNELLKGFPCL